jgi:uncharacterized damage-inducible protein DinB
MKHFSPAEERRCVMNRRMFLKSAAAGCGIAGAGLLGIGAARAATLPASGGNIIGVREGFSPQMGTLLSMLEWTRRAVVDAVQSLTIADLDYLHDAKANTIGALLLHLAATERHYQIHTFEARKWNDWDEETRKQWDVPAALGAEARHTIKGNDVRYYLDALQQVRERTITEFRKRDDQWLMQVDEHWAWGRTNNYCKWFHVCEHQSHHKGQVAWIKARLPSSTQSVD